MGFSLRSIEFWVTTILGGVFLACAFIFGDLKIQLAIIATYLVAVLGLAVSVLVQIASVDTSIASVDTSIDQIRDVSQRIAGERDVKAFYENTIEPLCSTFHNKDEEFRKLADNVLNDFYMKLCELGQGKCTFLADSWRVPYEEILKQEDVTFYQSIAWVKSERYWSDGPGRRGTDLNLTLAKQGKAIERIFILRPSIFNNDTIKQWIKKQNDGGIRVWLVKEERLPPVEDLRHDLGIYGTRATGYQYMNDNCDAERYEMYFNDVQMGKALRTFRGLKIYAMDDSEVNAYLAS